MSYDMQAGAIGFVFDDVITDPDTGDPVDLTDAATTQMILSGPSGPRLTKTATIVAPLDGSIRYTTIAGDIGQPGKWRRQAHVVFDDGSEFWSSVLEFTVGSNL